MAIFRILSPEGARDQARAKQRSEDLGTSWPGLPEPPQGLRDIRNHYEHFEERGLDEWVDSGSGSYIDMNAVYGGPIDRLIGGPVTHMRFLDEKDGRCRLGMYDLTVDIREAIEWTQAVASVVSQ